MPEHAIVGRITSDRVVKPFKDAGIEFTGEVSATSSRVRNRKRSRPTFLWSWFQHATAWLIALFLV